MRYVVPLTLLSALAFVPLVWLAFRAGIATDLPKARAQLRLAWVIAALAWACQLWLVAGVAPAVRGVWRGEPLSQLRAFTLGLAGLARGLVPCLIAVVAVGLGGLALVVPGAVLLVLFALTGASAQLAGSPPRGDRDGPDTAAPTAALADSAAIARGRFVHVAVLAFAIIAIDLAIAFALQAQLVPRIAGKVTPAQLEPIRTFVRSVPLALALVSPIAACALASAYVRLSAGVTRRTS